MSKSRLLKKPSERRVDHELKHHSQLKITYDNLGRMRIQLGRFFCMTQMPRVLDEMAQHIKASCEKGKSGSYDIYLRRVLERFQHILPQINKLSEGKPWPWTLARLGALNLFVAKIPPSHQKGSYDFFVRVLTDVSKIEEKATIRLDVITGQILVTNKDPEDPFRIIDELTDFTPPTEGDAPKEG